MNRGNARVLIVDDDSDIRTNFCDILQDLGYAARTAGDGVEAIDWVRRELFDVVLLDYKMPGMDGASLYKEIKKVQPAIAAIMITAWAGSEGVRQAKEAGTWDVLRKPVDVTDLLSKLSQSATASIVLVVDDDQEFCDSLWQVLNQRGFRVALAHSETQGIEKMLESSCDVAIVDLKLGDGDGLNVIKMIEEKSPHAQTIVISGFDDAAEQARNAMTENRIRGFFKKPIDVEKLLDLIASRPAS